MDFKKINTKNDKYIYQLLENPRFEISKDGQITHDGNKQKYRINKDGYPYYRITREDRKIDLLIHRLVWAKHGSEPLKEGYVINHKDGNKENNNIENLEQISQKENNDHMYAIGLRQPTKGHVVYSQEFADKIRDDHKNGLSYNDIISKYNKQGMKIGKSYVSQVINNKIWVK